MATPENTVNNLIISSIRRDYDWSTEHFHHHDRYEIYFLNEGERHFYHSGDLFTIKAGDVFLARPNVLHYAYGSDTHEKYGIEFTDKYLCHFLTPLVTDKFLYCFKYSHLRLTNEEKDMFRKAFLNALSEFSKETQMDNEFCFINLCVILGILKRVALRQDETKLEIPSKSNDKKLSNHLSYAFDFIRNNFTDISSLDEISSKCYIDKFYLSRAFKKNMGVTIMEYINSLKLQYACELLSTTNMSIASISDKCGFTNTSHFSTLFRKNIGISPTKFRKNHTGFSAVSSNSSI